MKFCLEGQKTDQQEDRRLGIEEEMTELVG